MCAVQQHGNFGLLHVEIFKVSTYYPGVCVMSAHLT